MSWLFSRALVEGYLEENSLDGELFALSNGKPTPLAFCAPDRMKAHSRLSRYGVTFAPLTEDLGEGLLKWYQGVFPVRTSVSREKVMDSKENEVPCGTKWRGWLAKFDPNSSLWRTAQCSLLEEESESLQTLPRWGMTQNGWLWELPMLAHHTNATAFGYSLPTPTASSMPCEGTVRIMRKAWQSGEFTLEEASAIAGRDVRKAQGKVPMMPTPNAWDGKRGPLSKELMDSKTRQISLVTYVRHNPEKFPKPIAQNLWATPTCYEDRTSVEQFQQRMKTQGRTIEGAELSMQVRMAEAKLWGKWGTPKAQDSRHALTDRGKGNLGEQVSGLHNGGKLNPLWVEWLMGYPIGWTGLSDAVTDKSPCVQQPLGES